AACLTATNHEAPRQQLQPTDSLGTECRRIAAMAATDMKRLTTDAAMRNHICDVKKSPGATPTTIASDTSMIPGADRLVAADACRIRRVRTTVPPATNARTSANT